MINTLNKKLNDLLINYYMFDKKQKQLIDNLFYKSVSDNTMVFLPDEDRDTLDDLHHQITNKQLKVILNRTGNDSKIIFEGRDITHNLGVTEININVNSDTNTVKANLSLDFVYFTGFVDKDNFEIKNIDKLNNLFSCIGYKLVKDNEI